jgi:hypothetical protein
MVETATIGKRSGKTQGKKGRREEVEHGEEPELTIVLSRTQRHR